MQTDKKQKSIKPFIALVLIIILQLGRLVYAFVYLKEDFHSDEMWSFGLSNSYYKPFVFQNAEHTEFINYKTWFSSKVMRDYLTVDKFQRFSYGSVYYNQVHDYHPPFYYFILHTICSFFPEKFSLWFSFSINIFSFIGTIIFLYLLMKEISHSEKLSLISCYFYGFSMGALNTFEFIRIYALATMISVGYLYYHALLYHSDKMKRNMIILFSITLIGSLTHHFFIPYACCVALCFCVYYLIKQNIRKLCIYSVTLLSAVAVSILIFPATIDHLFSGRIEGGKLSPIWQIKLVASCMTSELFGMNISPISKYSFTANLIVVICIGLIISPLMFLFRKEIWLKNAFFLLKRSLISFFQNIKQADLMIVAMIVSALGTVLLTALTVSYIYMGPQTDRYIFIAFPGVIVALVRLIGRALNFIKKKIVADALLCFICICLCFMSNVFGPSNYLFPKDEGAVSVQNVIADSNCVFISDDFWLMTCFTRLSMDADYIYALTAEDLNEDLKNISLPPDSNKEMYYYIEDSSLFVDYDNITLEGSMPERGMSRDQSQKLTQMQFESQLEVKYSMCKYIGFDNMFGRKFYIYKVN